MINISCIHDVLKEPTMKTRDQLHQAIVALQAQRAVLGEATYNTIIAALEAELAQLTETVMPAVFANASLAWLTFYAPASATGQSLIGPVIEQFGGYDLPRMGNYGGVVFRQGLLHDSLTAAVYAGLQLLNEIPVPMLVLLGPADQGMLDNLWGIIARTTEPHLYITESAYQPIRGVFVVHETAQPTVYQIVETKSRAFPIGRTELESISREMTGRDAELEQLRTLFKAAMRDRRATGALVVGNSGVGKSRLLLELDKWIELWPHNVWHLEGQGTPNSRSTVYGLVRSALAYRFEIDERDDEEVARHKLMTGISELLGADAQNTTHFIGQLVGYDFSTSPYLLDVRADSQLFREAAYEMLLRVMRAAAAQYNALIYLRLDDIHDSDAASLEMLQFLMTAGIDFPLVVVAATQPTLYDLHKTEQPLGSGFHVINLRSLSETTAGQLIDKIFGVGRLPLALRQELITRTGGNPYHLEEAIRLLQDEGILVNNPDGWHVADIRSQTIQIPSTVDGVLQARLNSLPPDAQTILQQAAVVGRVFWDKALFHLQAIHSNPHSNPHSEQAIESTLWVLHQRGMIAPRSRSAFDDANEYVFQQAAIHRATYDSVRQQQAQRYHLRIAQWLIGRTREGVGENASLIAQHFARANDVNRAIKWYALAAQQAFSAYLPERAVQYYELAFDLMPDYIDDLQLQIRLYEGYGRVLAAQGQYTDALAAYTAVCMAAEKSNNLLWQAQAWNAMSRLQVHLVEPVDALDYADRALKLAERAGEAGLEQLANAYVNYGVVYNSLDKPRDAIEWIDKALPIIQQLPSHSELLAWAYNIKGRAHYYLTEYDLTLAANHKALELLEDIPNKEIVSRVLNSIAFAYYRTGDFDAALRYSSQALHLSREYSARHDTIYFTNNYGMILAANGYYEVAETHLYQVLRMVGPLGWWGMVGTYIALAEAHIGLSKLRQAQEDATLALEWAKRTKNANDLGCAWRMLGTIADKRRETIEVDGRQYEAEDCFAKSRRALIGSVHRGELAHTLWAWGVYLRRRDPQRSARFLQEAHDLFVELNLTKFAECVRNEQ